MRTRFTSIIPRAAMALLVMLLTSVSALADDSGICGDNVTYSYVEATHTLTISGTSAIAYYSQWEDYRNKIRTVVINNGVTTIGWGAFSGCSTQKGRFFDLKVQSGEAERLCVILHNNMHLCRKDIITKKVGCRWLAAHFY